MSTKERFVGLTSIKVGAVHIATTVGVIMPYTFTTIQHIVPDSTALDIPEPTEQTVETEDSSEPDVVSIDEALKTFEFATRDMDLNVMVLGLGGVLSGSTVYKAPTTASMVIEKAVQLTTRVFNGFKYVVDIPRASLKAGKNLPLRNKNVETGTMKFRGTILQGYQDGGTKVPPYKFTKVAG